MADFAALPLFTDAYLADTSHLSDAEHGRYLLMLIHMWRTPRCRLPNEDEWLARKFKRSVDDIRSQFRPLIKEFFKTDGRWLFQKRLKKEKNYVAEKRRKSSIAAKIRWDKQKHACERNAPTPTPSPTIEYSNEYSTRDAIFEEFWKAYPARDGANPKHPARKAFLAAVKAGADPQAIVDGAKAYRSNPSTKVGTPYVATAVVWLHQHRWEDQSAQPQGRSAEAVAEDEQRKVYWLKRLESDDVQAG